MPTPRREIIDESESGVYHCITRCVRRSFLCGFDRLTGKDFSHRKGWIRNRLQELAGSFGVRVFGYAVMSNHLHVVVQTRVEEAGAWSVEEVARRWLRIFPRRRDEQGNACEAAAGEVSELAGDSERIEELRRRLCSVSWFMRCLNEHIARMANREEGCRGRFWEGRFKCQRLLDEGAVLACMAYVDLNPIRAGAAKSIEESVHTSAHERLTALRAQRKAAALRTRDAGGISGGRDGTELRRFEDAGVRSGWLGSVREPVVGVSEEEYLELLDWSGRRLAFGKRGRIPPEVEPVLGRLRLDHEQWLGTVESYGRLFWRVVGRAESIAAAARRAGRRWFKGVSGSRRLYADTA